MSAAEVSDETENKARTRLAFIESELAAYRSENERLAGELAVARRVIAALPFTGSESPISHVAQACRLPRAACAGDDILFHIDRCETGEKLVHISGWAFCPRIDCAEASIYLVLYGAEGPLFATPGPIKRPDVAAAFEKVDLGPSLPMGSEGRVRLADSGISALLERASLAPGQSYELSLQIEGPHFSVRKSTGLSLHA